MRLERTRLSALKGLRRVDRDGVHRGAASACRQLHRFAHLGDFALDRWRGVREYGSQRSRTRTRADAVFTVDCWGWLPQPCQAEVFFSAAGTDSWVGQRK
jgi:hypothetical protein